ncbi:MAG: protein kinase, partial [Anaerolineales bacterium]
MVLELVRGESLDKRLKRLAADNRRLPAGETAEIVAEIAEAMHYAHGQGLIHRDIKPANIMLGDRGQAVLMDFGVAKILGGTAHTATGMMVGTAFYISPEQVRGDPPNARSDIYSLGATLFETLAARPPFTGDSAMTVMLKHVNEPVPDLRRLAPDAPPYLIAVVEKAMAKDPRGRFATANDMAAALRQSAETPVAPRATLVDALPPRTNASAATVVDPLPASPPAPIRAPAVRDMPPKIAPAAPKPAGSRVPAAKRRTGWWIIGGLAAALLCLLAAGTAVLGGALALPFLTRGTAAAPTSEFLYQDDFANAGGGWTIESGAHGSAKYDGGQYVMQTAEVNWFVLGTGAGGEQSNIHIEVSASNAGPASDNGFGIICGYSDSSHFYYLGFNANGYYAIVKTDGGVPTILSDAHDQWVQSVRIARRADSYRIGADCASDGNLALYADGALVATANDTTFSSGVVGLFVRSFYEAPAEVRFDDLAVRALP